VTGSVHPSVPPKEWASRRFPVVTWIGGSGAFILRGAGFHTRGVVSRLRDQTAGGVGERAAGPNPAAAGQVAPLAAADSHGDQQQQLRASAEQQRYFAHLVALAPQLAPLRSAAGSPAGSLLSLDSLLLAGLDAMSQASSSLPGATPDAPRRAGGVAESLCKAAVRASQGAGQHRGYSPHTQSAAARADVL